MHRLIGNLVRAFFDSQLVYFKVISSWFTSLQWEKRLCNILMRILFITSISTIPKERVIVQGFLGFTGRTSAGWNLSPDKISLSKKNMERVTEKRYLS